MNLTLGPGLLESIVEHARKSAPVEGCGLIAGRNGVGTRFIPTANALESNFAYEIPPAELVGALRAMRECGDSLVAIYHSHPDGPAYPSASDIGKAFYPEAAHVIVSLENVEMPVVRGFRIIAGDVFEIELHAIV